MKYLFFIFSCWIAPNTFAQKTIVFDDKTFENKEWKTFDNLPDYVNAVELVYDSLEWNYTYMVNDSIEIGGNNYYIYSLKRKNKLQNKNEISTYLVKKVEEHFYTADLILHSSSFPTDLQPNENIYSVLENGKLTIYYDNMIREVIEL